MREVQPNFNQPITTHQLTVETSLNLKQASPITTALRYTTSDQHIESTLTHIYVHTHTYKFYYKFLTD